MNRARSGCTWSFSQSRRRGNLCSGVRSFWAARDARRSLQQTTRSVAEGISPFTGRTRNAHVARVTIIPMESGVAPSELAEESIARKIAEESTADPEKRMLVEQTLLRAGDGAETSKANLLDTFRTLNWLHDSTVPSAELDAYWDVLSSLHSDQIKCLIPEELAEVFYILASCNRRSPELVRSLSEHCRRTAKSFTAKEISLVMNAYGRMGWRSTRTMAQLSRRIVQLVESPATAQTVSTRHLRSIVGVYPRLGVPLHWPRRKGKPGSELELWKAIAISIPSRLSDMSPRDFSVILNAYAKMGLSFTAVHRSFVRMFELASAHLVSRIMSEDSIAGGDTFRPRDLALISNSYAKIRAGPYVYPLLQAVADKISPRLRDCNHQDVALMLNAFPKLEVTNANLFEAASPVIAQNIVKYDPQSLANVSHAFARQLVHHEAMFERIAVMSMRVMDKFNTQELSNLVYSFGRLQIRHSDLLASLRDEVIYRGTIGKSLQNVSSIYKFSLRCVEQLAWAFARLGVYDQRLFFVLFDLTRQRVRDFTKKKKRTEFLHGDGDAQAPEVVRAASISSWGEESEALDGYGLSILTSAFAKSRSDFHTLVRWVPRQIIDLKGQYTTWQLATMFNACTRLGILHPPLYREMLQYAKVRLPQMSPKAISMLVRGMSRAKMYNRVVMRQAVKIVSPRLKDLDVVDAGALLVGCAEMAYRDERFLRLLAAVVRSRMAEMSGSQLATALAAYCQMRIAHWEWLDAVLFELFRRQHVLLEKDSTNVAYAMLLVAASQIHSTSSQRNVAGDATVLHYPFNQHQGIFYSMLNVTNDNRRDLSYPSIYQLQIIELFIRLLSPQVYTEMRLDLKTLLAKARRVSVVVDDYMQNSSKMHRRISKWFTRVGLHHRSEVFLGPFMLDIVIGSRVIVEVDGPSHFYRDTNSRTAASLLKDMLLRKMGFYVKHLPYQEWAQCGSTQRKLLYCASFWREVLAAQTAELQSAPKLPPLMDVLDMVANAKLASSSEPEERLVEQGLLPAFYTDGGDADISSAGRNSEHIDTEAGAGSTFSIDGERDGMRPVEELLAAHRQAEERLLADRRPRREGGEGLSARQRARVDARNIKSKLANPEGASDEWEQSSIEGAGVRNTASTTSATLHHEAVKLAQLQALTPRSKRTAPVHSSSRLFDSAIDEADTESSDDEEGKLTHGRYQPTSRL